METSDVTQAGRRSADTYIPEITGEISYDLVMANDMEFVEGTYRINGGDWQVFIFSRDTITPVDRPESRAGRWPSGVSGIYVRVPLNTHLNKEFVERCLSQELAVASWVEVHGPDSIQLR